MFEFIHKHKRLLQIILAVLIVPPFEFFGIDFYFRGSDSADQVARVAGTRISQQEFGQALRALQQTYIERSRRLDPAAWGARALRERLLEDALRLVSPLL